VREIRKRHDMSRKSPLAGAVFGARIGLESPFRAAVAVFQAADSSRLAPETLVVCHVGLPDAMRISVSPFQVLDASCQAERSHPLTVFLVSFPATAPSLSDQCRLVASDQLGGRLAWAPKRGCR
jgi:hypothetical protein